MTTLQDIADYLGLSRATVSRALNGYPEVGQKTRERVQEAALKLNYQPNLNARQLATGRSGIIAMMMLLEHNQIQDLNQLEFMTNLTLAIEKGGLDMVFHVVTQVDDLEAYRRLLNRGAVDGMILNRPHADDPRIPLLQAANMPFVMHGHSDAKVSYAYFDIDNKGAFAEATELLLNLGHRNIAFINGPERMSYANQRLQGALSQYKKLKIDAKTFMHIPTDLTEAAGYHWAMRALSGELNDKPTAFLCSTTSQAAGVYRAAAQHSLVVGKDIAVIAHDDDLPHWQATQFEPPLTVTYAPIRDACEPLATIIIELIAGANPLKLQQMTQPQLIVRESTQALASH